MRPSVIGIIATGGSIGLIFRPLFFDPDVQDASGRRPASTIKPVNWSVSESTRAVDVDQLARELALTRRLAVQHGAAVSLEMETSVAHLRKRFGKQA